MRSFMGKYFSILGDSISTLLGYNPKEYDSFYKQIMCEYSGIKTPMDTWWGQVIYALGGKLLVNNSWSGSLVVKHPDCRIQSYACSNERTLNLGENGINPDVVMIYMGTNDSGWNVQINGNDGDVSCFKPAYMTMLEKIKTNYPNSEIWCFTLCRRADNDGNYMKEYCAAIRECAKSADCRIIELYDKNVRYATMDELHPNAEGMKTIAEAVLSQV